MYYLLLAEPSFLVSPLTHFTVALPAAAGRPSLAKPDFHCFCFKFVIVTQSSSVRSVTVLSYFFVLLSQPVRRVTININQCGCHSLLKYEHELAMVEQAVVDADGLFFH